MNTLVRYNQLPAFADHMVARELNRFFGHPGSNLARYQKPVSTVPATNIKEDESAFYLEVAAPGLKKENFTVNVENKTLTIAFKQEGKADQETGKFTHKEFGYAAFERTYHLPKNVNVDQIQATYIDGILKVALPKVEVKKAEPKEIEVL